MWKLGEEIPHIKTLHRVIGIVDLQVQYHTNNPIISTSYNITALEKSKLWDLIFWNTQINFSYSSAFNTY